MRGKGRGEGNGDRAGKFAVAADDLTLQAEGLALDRLGARHKALANIGQGIALRPAVEQAGCEGLFQRADSARHRGVADRQTLRRRAHGA